MLRGAPRAVACVHPLGARHLADPARLVASATQLYGDRMDELWGPVLPVPRERLRVAADGEEVRVGTRRLRALDTPGHASHHHAWHEPGSGVVFSGDVGGIRLQGAPYVCAPTPPPDIDLDAWGTSLARLAEVNPSRLLLTHFGGVDDVAWHLDDLAQRLELWREWTRARLAAGERGPALEAALTARAEADIRAAGGGEAAVRAYARAVPYGMMAAGLERWAERFPAPAE
jgi:glyoxylase-like metal-dependent hydrolase (beta-lactamase superfamily II)